MFCLIVYSGDTNEVLSSLMKLEINEYTKSTGRQTIQTTMRVDKTQKIVHKTLHIKQRYLYCVLRLLTMSYNQLQND